MVWLKQNEDNKLVVYAELSRRQFNMVVSGDYIIELPYGVEMKNNKRGLYFYCQDEDASDVLVEALDADGINWQYI